MTDLSVVAHLVPYALYSGFGGNVASLSIGASGLGSVLGCLVLGPIARRFGRLPNGLTRSLVATLMLVWLVLAGRGGLAIAYLRRYLRHRLWWVVGP